MGRLPGSISTQERAMPLKVIGAGLGRTGTLSLKAALGWVTAFVPRMVLFNRMLDRLIWDGMFGGRFEDRAHAVEVFNRHNEAVKQAVAPDRLLVYEVKEGWGPLCSFLGVPVPEGRP